MIDLTADDIVYCKYLLESSIFSNYQSLVELVDEHPYSVAWVNMNLSSYSTNVSVLFDAFNDILDYPYISRDTLITLNDTIDDYIVSIRQHLNKEKPFHEIDYKFIKAQFNDLSRLRRIRKILLCRLEELERCDPDPVWIL